jgi:hypothetical protein
MDVLLDWLDQRDNYKRDRQAIQDAFDAQNRCGKYLGIEFSDNQENISFINNPPTSRKQGWNQQKESTHPGKYSGNYNSSNFKQLPLRDLILEQAILEDINAKLDDFSSAIKDQLNHNNQIETRLAQLAATLPFTTRGGRSTRDPPYPKGTTRRQAAPVILIVTEEKDDEVEELEPPVPQMT